MEKTNEINDFKQRLSNLENLRKESLAPEKSGRGGRAAKVMIVLKWYNKVRKEGVEVELPEGKGNILLDRAIELVRALEEEDKKNEKE